MLAQIRALRKEAIHRDGSRLPLYRWDRAGYAAYYAPGCLVVVDRDASDQFEAGIGPPAASTPSDSDVGWGAELWRSAEAAVSRAAAQRDGPFEPECLTLYLNTECNLRCTYCHTDPTLHAAERLDAETVAAAAHVVARSCRQKDLPLTVVFHGGGEPTLHRDQVDGLLDLLERIAASHGLEPFRYVATNGQLSEASAAWLARRFDLAGLSCDGPPDIHDRQRPRWDGGHSLPKVESTGRILREEGCPYHVRTTITPASMNHQATIATYVCQTYAPEEIHFEPVYLGGRAGACAGLQPHHAEAFTDAFLAARRVARRHGVPLLTSGTRPGQIHGPFCHVHRQTINLLPGGVATACFKLTTASQAREAGAAIGQRDPESDRFVVDHERVRTLQRALDVQLAECATCFNRFHCSRECPDWCPLDAAGVLAPEPRFRCRAQRAVAAGILFEAADSLWEEARAAGKTRPNGTRLF